MKIKIRQIRLAFRLQNENCNTPRYYKIQNAFILHHLDALNIFSRAGFASVRNPNAFVIIQDVLKTKIVRLFGVHLRIDYELISLGQTE